MIEKTECYIQFNAILVNLKCFYSLRDVLVTS